MTCGPGGVQTRSRFVVQPALGEGAKPCEGDQIEKRDCPDIPDCPTATTISTPTITTTTPTPTITSTTTATTASFIISELTTDTIETTNTENVIQEEEEEESSSEERKVLEESFIDKLLNALSDVAGTDSSLDVTVTEQTPEEVVKSALSSE